MKSVEQSEFFSKPELSPVEKKNREFAFREIVIDKLVASFVAELEEIGFTEEEINQFTAAAAEEQDHDYLENILAVPWQLRSRWIREAKDKSDGGRELFLHLKEKFEMLTEFQGGKSPKIGFHTSDRDLSRETRKSRFGKEENIWEVSGTEQSDLAEGLLAHASDSYESLYRDKRARFLYVVRISDPDKKYGEGETSWYYSPSFPIVTKLELEPLDDQVLEKAKEYQEAA